MFIATKQMNTVHLIPPELPALYTQASKKIIKNALYMLPSLLIIIYLSKMPFFLCHYFIFIILKIHATETFLI